MTTHYKIGQIKKHGWQLIDRWKRVEFWKNTKNQNYSIELYEFLEQKDDYWLMHKIVSGEKRASVVSQRKIYNDLATIDCKEIIEL
jgi:hypothetical protein